MLTDGCSRIAAALILMIPLLFVEFLFKMPVEFFMHITDDTSLIPLMLGTVWVSDWWYFYFFHVFSMDFQTRLDGNLLRSGCSSMSILHRSRGGLEQKQKQLFIWRRSSKDKCVPPMIGPWGNQSVTSGLKVKSFWATLTRQLFQ